MADKEKICRHVAIIMDGNGRWAEAQGLPRADGHRRGAERVSDVMKAAKKCGVKYLTLYAFSTENWKRSPMEINAIMSLLGEFLDNKLPDLQKEGISLRTVGRTDELPSFVRKKLYRVIDATKNNKNGVLNLALNYGGRAEIVDAVNKILTDKSRKNNEITEADFGRYLYAPDLPDPDLMIRTSGELRLSNFLLWELSYSELYVTEKLWPDFGEEDFIKAVESFGGRKRRFGGREEK
ncbi:MAG: polyprenyl diphosphate synthase [Victivallaceae bacterium]|nr:polyprenyl diphosphate synthase [Victivallaceae bacterium]